MITCGVALRVGSWGLRTGPAATWEAAYRAFRDAWASLRMAGDITQEVGGAFVLADIRTAQGRLREAAGLMSRLCSVRLERAGPCRRQRRTCMWG